MVDIEYAMLFLFTVIISPPPPKKKKDLHILLKTCFISLPFRHIASLGMYVRKVLLSLRHENGADVCTIYGTYTSEVSKMIYWLKIMSNVNIFNWPMFVVIFFLLLTNWRICHLMPFDLEVNYQLFLILYFSGKWMLDYKSLVFQKLTPFSFYLMNGLPCFFFFFSGWCLNIL